MRNSVTLAGRTYFWCSVIKIKTYDVNVTDRKYVLTANRTDRFVSKLYIGKSIRIWET